jgi:AcrR family transcriptional regulator
VTTGSLYRHFAGKTDLFAELIRSELQRTAARFAAIAPGDAEAAAKAFAACLSLHHVKHPGAGCVLPSLAPDVARADESVRDAYQAGVLAIHALIADRLAGSGDTAWAIIAQSVGAVMLARAVPDDRVCREILGAAGDACAALLGSSGGDSARR